ncbi:dioxygenase [Pontibacter sp. E15-1]|uniref:VOC family protein n=1 Tax=Pontibacter sp. E15-1 TaxID=2919918 RepID=UPI001F500EF6|nr:dioxygenase [Pontibacter sp. E15-1]MCJ8163403.1 dioxygenase [Pontibacter sp. E15-1]
MNPFHLAFKVKDIASTRRFYIEILACPEGRSTASWIDFDFFGHQLSAHVSDSRPALNYCGKVDGVRVPIPHFGCILEQAEFDRVQEQLLRHDIAFIIKPQTRYEGQPGEQRTMFVLDLSGNPIEFKSFRDKTAIFAT